MNAIWKKWKIILKIEKENRWENEKRNEKNEKKINPSLTYVVRVFNLLLYNNAWHCNGFF